jgi:hypothetical protein
MRKIDKTKILSTKYKQWVDKLNRDKVKHPQNSNKAYYCDVVMNLLHCQKGVCAYTEMRVCDPGLLNDNNWENGRYKLTNSGQFGELEHFDPNLKKDKFWEWENLFVAASKINKRKGTKEVDYILKPDSPEYDPMVLLEYDIEQNLFIPHKRIKEKTTRDRIQHMIDVLQLNWDGVHRERKRFLKKVFEFQDFEQPIEIDQFFTAYEMASSARKEVEG